MENDFNISEKPKNSQKIKPKKLIFRIIVAVVAIAAAVGVYFGIQYLIKINKENADIKVGDTIISKSDIQKISNQAADYKKNNPNAVIDDEFAKSALIDNAALKYYARNKCNQGISVTPKDVFNFSQGANLSSDSDPVIASTIGKEGDFYYITQENALYKKKLHDCLIIRKSIFSVSISYETPYMIDVSSDAEANIKYEKAKKILNDRFLPLFKNGASKEDIAKLADADLISDPTAENFSIEKLSTQIVSFAQMIDLDAVSGTSGFQTDTPKHKGNIGDVVELGEIVKNLKVGQHSNVVVTSSGVFAIVRAEKTNDGVFNDWNEFSAHITKEFKIDTASTKDKASALDLRDRVCYTIATDGNGTTISCQAYGNGSWVSKPGFVFSSPGYQGDVGRHMKAVIVRAWDGAPGPGGIPLNGVAVSSWTGSSSSSDTTSYARYGGVFGGVGAFEGNGYAFALGDCNVGKTMRISISAPSGYVYTGGDIYHNFVNGNFEAYFPVDISLRRDVQPPADIPYYPSLGSRTNTQVSVDNGGWKYGEGHLAPVGSKVRFKHEVYGDVYGGSEWDTATLSWNTDAGQRGVKGLSLPQRGLAYTRTESGRSILHSDVGKVICDRISATINNVQYKKKGVVKNGKQAYEKEYVKTHSTSSSANRACVYVPYEYELKPCIRGSGATCGGVDIPGDPGGAIPTIPEVNNPNGNTPSRPDTQWVITTWTVGGNYEDRATPNDVIDNSNGNTCSVYAGAYGVPLTNCRVSERGNQPFDPGKKTRVGIGGLSIPDDAPLGSRYCIALSVSPYKMGANESQATQNQKVGTQWRHSVPLCLKATKKPKLQVWGNGIYSRGGVVTSRSNVKGSVFGSWVEYEAIAGGKVNGFTSESSNTGNRLTFANDKSGTKGNWGSWTGATETNRIISNIRGRYPRSRDGVVRETRNGIYGGHDGNTTPNIHTRIIDSNGMFLTGNITSRNPVATDRIRAFQQTIIIVDGDLYISKDVTKIDAWLIVKGKIVTCATGQSENSAIVNNNNCGKTLQINGPIIANNLKSWRTGGSEFSNPGLPSETYNQRADVYLWAYVQGTLGNKMVTTYTKEIPVRY